MGITVDLLSRTEAGAPISATQFDTFVAAIEATFADVADDDVQIIAGDGLTGGGTLESSRTIAIATQAGVVAGAYTNTNITVDARGIITAIATGSTANLPIDDATAVVKGSGDPTKLVRIEADGVATGTTRVITMPNQDVDLTPTTGTFLGSGAGVVALSKLSTQASPTVVANVSGSTASPSAVSPSDFKTQFGFGSLASQSTVGLSDLSATGTPSSSTFLRGDYSWASTVPTVVYDVTDIDDGTTLTAAHSRYQLSAGSIIVTQLRLRNSSTQSDPVTVILEDSDTVTPAGAEFSLLQADDQTGLCVIRAEANGSINGFAYASGAVADCVMGSSSGTQTTFTSAGGNFTSATATVGAIWKFADHSTAGNNGFYRTIGSPTTSAITAIKLTGTNPANAGSEAVTISTGYIALGGARASALVIIDSNPTATPVARLEGETYESRTVLGNTVFSHDLEVDGTANFDGAVDFDGALDLSATLTLSGSGSIQCADLAVNRALLGDTAETVVDAGNKSGGASFDYTAGAWQYCTATGNITSVTITNPPATGRLGTLTLEIAKTAGTETIAWGAAFTFPGGTDSTLSASTAPDIFVLTTRDAGTTWRVYDAGKAFAT